MFKHRIRPDRKVSKYGLFSGSYFPSFGLDTGKYGPEKTPYLDTFHTVEEWHGKTYSFLLRISLPTLNLLVIW